MITPCKELSIREVPFDVSVSENASAFRATTVRVSKKKAYILAAIRALLARSGRDSFTPAQVVAEIKRRGTGYADATIRTMVTGHMCRNAPDNAGTTYDDLERINRGVYRLNRNGHADDRLQR
ncbi:hypothetical protein [Nonomuraea sp. NPDC023979]|uniref:DUF7669 domain-containing protein n=1 Tax=Nonomuraea sp. NPDC023979 TaxID=3154796 RepID=UPI00340CB4F4